ncbi:MAG: hypothetical protein NC131_18675 [Roseburia sp.]|nr:hypothetical protein [Roseburia sp.]
MKNFIEVTLKDGTKTMIAAQTIRAIVSETDGTYIETEFDGKRGSTGIFVIESYEKVKQLLNEV